MSQFTINPDGRTTITPKGVVVVDRLAERPAAAAYEAKPVQVRIRPGLQLQLHGCAFDASVQLTPADALYLISRLSYEVAEHLPAAGEAKCQA